MGCFAGCFGLSSNTKHRNSTRKILPRHQRISSYEPLLSSDPSDSNTNVDTPDKISSSNLLRCEVEAEEDKKEGTKKKTRKRVRFNLNVQTFEPTLPSRYENYCSDDEEGQGEGDIKKPEDPRSRSLYPSNYRYHNCLESLEDEDELRYGESDLEDEDYYTDDENDYEDDADDEDEVCEDQDVTPLLNPVENIAQWKVVKAKPVRVKQLMKENVVADSGDDQARPLLKEIIVNTSLADWLASPKSFHGNGSCKRFPIGDITNMENRSKVS
ncbi:Uncharacterized protein HA466_0061480 [Hirschfeldia incana]|nr:Uncharacterized protein HA466_0061480 [Hirschfeldia incana]